MTEQIRDRFRGALLGAAIGDALGAPYEFKKRLSMSREQVMSGYKKGVFGTKPGAPTDDSTLVRLHAEALLAYDGTTCSYQSEYMDRLLAWKRSNPPDIGGQTRRAITAWQKSRKAPPATDSAAGNGSLMAVVPVALLANTSQQASVLGETFAGFTHPSAMAKFVNRQYCAAIQLLTGGNDPASVEEECGVPRPYGEAVDGVHIGWCALSASVAFDALYGVAHDVCSSPYEALVRVIRQGGDTDTNACIAGALIGAAYGSLAWAEEGHNAPRWLLGDLVGFGAWIALADDLYEKSQN